MFTAETLRNTAPVVARLDRPPIRRGDTLYRFGASDYQTRDGRTVPAWIVALHLGKGKAFEAIPIGQRNLEI